MKNRYLKGAHISERKVKEHLKLLRTQIAQFSDEHNPILVNYRSSFYLDFYNATRPDEEVHILKKPLYGIYRADDKIHTEEISALDPTWVHDWLKRKVKINEL